MVEEKKKDEEITVELSEVKLLRILSLGLFIMLSLCIAFYLTLETYTFNESPCDAIEEQIKDKKDMWDRHCGLIIEGEYDDISMTGKDIIMTNTNWTRWE